MLLKENNFNQKRIKKAVHLNGFDAFPDRDVSGGHVDPVAHSGWWSAGRLRQAFGSGLKQRDDTRILGCCHLHHLRLKGLLCLRLRRDRVGRGNASTVHSGLQRVRPFLG